MSDEWETKEMIAVSPPIDSRGGRHTIERAVDGSICHGYCVPIVDGQSIPPDAKLCEIRQRDDGVWEKRSLRSGGPSIVNSPEYRSGWNSIFGKQPIGEA